LVLNIIHVNAEVSVDRLFTHTVSICN